MKNRPVLLYVCIAFLISFADGIMSYISPIFIESRVNSALLMGIIFSFSSVVGIACDIAFPKIFRGQPQYFFLKTTLLAAVLFPLIYLLFPNHILTFLIAMSIWGIYYELNIFSSFHFVSTYVQIPDHTKTWGLLQAFRSFAYAISPLLAIQLLKLGYTVSFIVVCAILAVSLIPTIIFKNKFVRSKKEQDKNIYAKRTWLSEFHVWKLLFPKVWPLLLLLIAITTVDAGFWTVGTLLTQRLSEQHPLGSLLLTAYITPAIIVGFIISKQNQKSRKKRTAIISSLLAGLLLSTFAFLHTVPLILLVSALTSFFTGIAIPELMATFENYVTRLKENGNDMIGLQGTSSSMAYVIGPILATFFAGFFGYQESFTILGVLLALVSAGVLIITPNKIKMPQKELAKA